MACSFTLTGIPRDCEGAPGGLKRMLVIDHSKRGTYTQADGNITAITPAEAAKFVEVYFPQNSASMTATLAIGDADNRTFNNTIAFNTGKLSASKLVQVQSLMLGEWAAIAEGYDGNFYAIGFDNVPLRATEGAPTTGTATTDAQSTPMTMAAVEVHLPFTVDPAIIDALIA